MIPTQFTLNTSPAVLDSDGQTVRISLPLDKSKSIFICNKYHQMKQIERYFPCTCKMIWLKREVGYKNVSLFGKLSRFSWNYGGLCSNFAPNSLSIEGRYGYAAVPHKERQDQSSVLSRKAGGRKRDGDMMGLCINLYHTCAAQTSASSSDPSNKWRRSRKRQ